MGQAASDPIGSARQLKDQDLLALWQSQIGPNGTIADHVAKARDQDGRSALHIAASEGKQQAVSLLLKCKAIPPNTADNNLITPLHSAVFRNHSKIALALLENGADINAQDLQGLTALHWSVINGSLKCIDVLLENGADASIKNLKSQTALDVARTLKPRLRDQVIARLNRESPAQLHAFDVQPKASTESDHASEFAAQQLFANMMDGMGRDARKMLALCKLWGLIKYTHPYLAYKLIKWDEDLMEAVSIVSDPSINNKQFYSAIMKLLSKLNDPNTRMMHGQHVLTPDRLTADSLETSSSASSSSMVSDASHQHEELSNLGSPAATQTGPSIYPKVTLYEDNLALVDCTDFLSFQASSLTSLVQTFANINASSVGIIFDVRCLAQNGQSAATVAKYSKEMANFGKLFQEAFRALIPDPLVLPLTRQRVYHGLPEHVPMSSTGPNSLEHGFFMSEAVVLHPLIPASHPLKRRPYSFIIDKYTPIEVIHIAMALQARSQASIVVVSEKDDSFVVGDRCLIWEPGIQTTEFRLSDLVEGPGKSTYGDITIQIRQNERFSPDSTVGLRPDHLVQIEFR